MAENDINIRMSAEDDASKPIQDVARAEGELASATREAGQSAEATGTQQATLDRAQERTGETAKRAGKEQREGAAATRDAGRAAGETAKQQGLLQRATGGVLSQLRTLAGPVLGLGTVIAFYREYNEILRLNTQLQRENAQASADAQRSGIDLAFLGVDADTRQQVREMAAASGRSGDEGQLAFGDIVSRRSTLGLEGQLALFEQVLETAVTTQAPLQAVANGLLTVQKFEPDAQRSQNIVREAIVQAGVTDPAKLAPLFATYLGIGTGIADMTAGETAGAIAGATGLGLEPSTAVTGLRGVTSGMLAANPSAEAKGVIAKGEIDTSSLMAALESTVQAIESGRLREVELVSIVGEEGLPLLTGLADPERFATFKAAVDAVGAAQRSDDDLTSDAIKHVHATDPGMRLDFVRRRAEAQAMNAKAADPHSQRVEAAKAIITRELDEAVAAGETSAAKRKHALEIFDEQVAKGFTPYYAAYAAQTYARGSFLGFPGFGRDVDLPGSVGEELAEDAFFSRSGQFDPRLPGAAVLSDRLPEEVLMRLREETPTNTTIINIGQQNNMSTDGLDAYSRDSGRRDR